MTHECKYCGAVAKELDTYKGVPIIWNKDRPAYCYGYKQAIEDVLEIVEMVKVDGDGLDMRDWVYCDYDTLKAKIEELRG